VRRLSPAVFAVLLAVAGCRQEKIHLEPTEEGTLALASTVQMGDRNAAMQLVRGFHAIEGGTWRWTMGRFAITLRVPEGAARDGAKLVVRFVAPEPVVEKLGPGTLTAKIGERVVGSSTFREAGQQTLTAAIPAADLRSETATFNFALDKYLAASGTDGRELGVIVESIGLN
jgi:hypothetical protein